MLSLLKKILPHPLLTMTLWVVWLLLNNTVAAGHIVLGLVIAILVSLLSSKFRSEDVRVAAPFTLLKFFVIVLWDIVIANLTIAKLILGNCKNLKPAFIVIKLDIQTPLGISVLANTISLTPGTVSCDLSRDRRYLLVHVLHAEDVSATINEIKQRYETPLKEIFLSC